MRIELTDDDSAIQPDGKPTLVVLLIDGQRRIPYPATKTIQELYLDVMKFNKSKPTEFDPSPETFKTLIGAPFQEFNIKTIAREDIIRVKGVTKDVLDNNSHELEIGKNYRVMDIIKQNGVVHYYEVLDDKTNQRMAILPQDVELIEKFIPPPKRLTAQEIVDLHKGKTDEELARLQ